MSILRSVSRCLKRFARPAITPYFCTNAATDTEMSAKQKRIVWIDMEMTGLDPEKHKILEIACVITDENLKIISNDFQMVLNQPENELDKMDEWCKKTHGQSNLVNDVKESKFTEKDVDEKLLFFMMQHIPKGKCPMAGNSVYMDRLFLRKYMPISNDFMHYRIIDVSSIKEVVKRWKPDIYARSPKKLLGHRALEDVKGSIQELDYYRKNVFNASIDSTI